MKIYRGVRTTGGSTKVGVQVAGFEARNLPHVVHHSPTGFEWGYAGSGPADLALSILADYFEETQTFVLSAIQSMWATRSKAATFHQQFKASFVQHWGPSWRITSDEIHTWVKTFDAAMVALEETNRDLAAIAELDMLEKFE